MVKNKIFLIHLINSFKKIVVTFSFILLFSSCNDDGTKADYAITSIPYIVGTSNSYRWSNQVDSAGVIIQAESDSFTIRVKSTSETINGLNNLTLLEATRLSGTEVLQKVWYNAKSDSLTEIAYRFGTGFTGIPIFPKHNSRIMGVSLLSIPRSIEMILSKKPGIDTLILRDDPRIVYRFPLSVGKKWTSFRSPFIQTREVVGVELVTVKSGIFPCIKIKSTIGDLTSDALEYYDYVNQNGLILRTFTARLIYTTELNPDGIGIFATINERLELIAHN